jgi:hypothetical protein
MDWYSRMVAARNSLLRDYVNRSSCFIYNPESPATLPFKPNATDVLDIVVVKDLVLPVCLLCCALSSDHVTVMIDITFRTPFRNNLKRPDSTRMDWASFHAYLQDRLPGNLSINNEEAVDNCVEVDQHHR